MSSKKQWSKKHLHLLESTVVEIKNKLVTPMSYGEAKTRISTYLRESPFGYLSQIELRERIEDSSVLKRLPIRWPGLKENFRVIVTTADSVEPVEIAMAFFADGYFCFSTALFQNNLSGQVSANFFVATERKTPGRTVENVEIDDFSLREAFMKPPRETRKVGHFGKTRFTIIEREHSGFLGVVEKKTNLSGRTATVRYTDVARTLLDAAMHPHRCGGVLNVIDAFEKAGEKKFSLKKLIDYYEQLNPVYPYWQRIGLILKFSGNRGREKAWKAHFGSPTRLFFLDRPYKTDWPVDEEWKVAFPPGLRK